MQTTLHDKFIARNTQNYLAPQRKKFYEHLNYLAIVGMKKQFSVINVGKGKQMFSYIMQIKAHFIVILQICFGRYMIGCSIVNLLCYCVCGEPRPSSDLLVLFVISN